MTQSDESDNEKKTEKVVNYVAFGIYYDSEHEASESNSLVNMVFVIMNQKRRVICKILIIIYFWNAVN